MTDRPSPQIRILVESALGAFLGALLVFAALRLTGALSPAGTVTVPAITFLVSTFVVFVLRSRKADGARR